MYASATSPVVFSHNLLGSSDQVKVWFLVMDGKRRHSTSVRVGGNYDIDDVVKAALEMEMVNAAPGMVCVKLGEKDVKTHVLVSTLHTTAANPLLVICPVDEGVYI